VHTTDRKHTNKYHQLKYLAHLIIRNSSAARALLLARDIHILI